jgi:hypothetical protein
MRKPLFIMSHLGSGSTDLFDILQAHPRIDGFRTGMCYDHADKLFSLMENIHKRDNSTAIYMDELLFNTSFASRHLCPYCKFIYLIREPKASLNLMLRHHPEYNLTTAARYYCYRMRGIYEYFRRTRDAVFMTWDDIPKNLEAIRVYLGLKEPLVMRPLKTCDLDMVPIETLNECQECYERYIYHIKELV